jgi:hypothetical protein
MNQQEASNMISLIKAINGNKAAVEATGGGIEPWWRTRLHDGTADQWLPLLEAYVKDGTVEIRDAITGNWRADKQPWFNGENVGDYRPIPPKLCVWAVIRDRAFVCVNFTEGAADLAAGAARCRVVRLEEVDGE